MKKFAAVFCLLSILLTQFAQAQTQDSQEMSAQELMQVVHEEMKAMDPIKRTAFKANLDHLLEESNRSRTLPKMSNQNKWLTPFTCIGGQGGLVISGMLLKCVNVRGQTFDISVMGIRLSALVSGNLALGYTLGPVKNGSFGVDFEAGGYFKFGGSAYIGEDIVIAAPGIGIGAHLSYGVPEDSMFGGQINITNTK